MRIVLVGAQADRDRLRRELRTKGLARARQFSWEASVRRVRDIYGEVAQTVAGTAHAAHSDAHEEARL